MHTLRDMYVCVYRDGVFSCWLLKLPASTKGCVPTLLYGLELNAVLREVPACQQQQGCFTATRRHPGTGAPAALPCFMTVGQDVAVLSVSGRGHKMHYYFSVGERRVKWVFI